MTSSLRGLVALFSAAALLFSFTAASAQDKTVLATERDKVSYMVGSDIGRSIAPVGPDLDMAAFERAIRNAFSGGQPLLSPEEADRLYAAMGVARDIEPPGIEQAPELAVPQLPETLSVIADAVASRVASSDREGG